MLGNDLLLTRYLLVADIHDTDLPMIILAFVDLTGIRDSGSDQSKPLNSIKFLLIID